MDPLITWWAYLITYYTTYIVCFLQEPLEIILRGFLNIASRFWFLSNNQNQQQQISPTTLCNISDIIPVKPTKGNYICKFTHTCKKIKFGVKKFQETHCGLTPPKGPKNPPENRHRRRHRAKSGQIRLTKELSKKTLIYNSLLGY